MTVRLVIGERENMTATDYWMADAEYLSVNDNVRWLIGEDENADWWVPYPDGQGVFSVPAPARAPHTDWQWTRFNRWNPLHWLRYWNSRRRNQVVFLFG
jgi:hypothetical protein